MSKTLNSLFAAIVFVVGSAYGQETLTFSGGSGTPLSITLAQPVQFGILSASTAGNAPVFVFKLLGNLFSGNTPLTGTITFSVSGGPNQTLNTIGSNLTSGSIAANDGYIFGSLPGVGINDKVQLNAGTLTTTASVAAARPADGAYTTFITNVNGTRLSTNAFAVPEPQSLALLVTGAGLLLVAYTARRRVWRSHL